MSSNIQGVEVFGNRIVVVEREVGKIGSIFVPAVANKTQRIGTVEAVGEGRLLQNGQFVPHAVKPGDLVLCEMNAAQEISVAGMKYLVYRMEDIICKLDPNVFT